MADATNTCDVSSGSHFTLTAGVDWLSLSCAEDARGTALWRALNDLMSSEEPMPSERKPWHIRAFSGSQTESYALATDGQYVIGQLRGGQAEANWREMMRFAENVSRIDLQVTVDASERYAGVAQKVYRSALAGTNRGGRPPACALVVNSQKGETAYIGRRTSDYFLRVYDKGVQSESALPGHLWRWEVEIKGLPAWHLARTALTELWTPAKVASYVRRQFQLRGVEPSWEASGEVSVAPVIKEHQDDRRSLEWLRQAVPYTMTRLVRHGFGAEVAQIVDGIPGLRAMLKAPGDVGDTQP